MIRNAKVTQFVLPIATACLMVSGGDAQSSSYYVSERGIDSASGSIQHPWRTLARVNEVNLRPGDRVLLRGGDRFSGTLFITASDAGSQRDPVVISSYGSGRAV